MTQTTCPQCGYTYDFRPPVETLPDREQKALRCLRVVIQRAGGRLPSTPAVALEMGYSSRWAYEFLRSLENKGYVHRPDGPRSGWAVVKEHDHMAIELMRVA
jgi:DNA-binding IscR family transcriptional regulator